MMRLWIISVMVFVLAGGVALRAEDSKFNVDFFCGWGDCYRPMEWTPLEIGIGSTLEKPLG
ncbi:MAG: hypothetical protein ACYS8Z_05070, partial [Planctomycetota bacterium]